MVATSSRSLSCEVWLMLMRKMSEPASNRRRIVALSDDAGPRVARILLRRSRLIAGVSWFGCRRRAWRRTWRRSPLRSRQARHIAARSDRAWNARYALLRRLFVGFGELHGPGPLVTGIHLEEAGAIEAARQAVFGTLDGNFLVARAHEGLTRPLAAAVIIERIDVII